MSQWAESCGHLVTVGRMVRPEAHRPRRGRPSSLTHEQIVLAVLRLAAEQRLEDVSMRMVAAELGVPVTTLYGYVPNRDELNGIVVDHILRDVPVPGPDEGPWHERIRKLERHARQALARHRGVSLRNGVRSREATRLAEGVVDILTSSGFEPDEATHAFVVLYTFMLGQVEVDAFFDTPNSAGEPTFEGIARDARHSLDELFEYGFDVVLAGLAARMHAARD